MKQGGNTKKMYPRYMYADVDGFENIEEINSALRFPSAEEREENIIRNLKTYIPIERLHIHAKCFNKVEKDFRNNSIRVELNRGWSNSKEKLNLVDPAIAEKYRFLNMRQPSLDAILKADLRASMG
jgi:hypothetical protein